ncbi:HD domain-containing protein [Nocardia sp. CDC159]|uniref:HD domain-containing protein n=1 Tax=Nocardia pulmonis TaxID=2951408 RepID=A0A9X2IVQ0_9NOCA|nr:MULTISPECIES: HD domain-containing protein [Nocardia]MCM6772030.1 HD domain-containing protein [Nocardia pulmonis]MCM6785312.1 HD domain-containing protein [Nocardia sp. CDC159]
MNASRRTVLGAGLAATASVLATGPAQAGNPALALPPTPLAERARRLADDTLEPHLRNHSVRGFLFGRAAAAAQGALPGRDYDEELMFLISILHDIGLSEPANGDQRFEIDGADFAARFLEDNGVTDARVDIVWDAIAAHTMGFIDSPVYRRRRAPEIWISVAGIGIDIFGGPADLPPGVADLVHAAYPRLGGTRALTDSVERQALAKPQKATPATLAGEILRERHPDLDRGSWGALLETNGWRD